MKKTISITISGLIFHIEEDGYQALKQYLDEIQRYFSSYQDGSEIVADIENRIAEIFSEKITAGKTVVTKEEVEKLITSLGTISDFKAAEEENEPEMHTNQLNSDLPPLPKPKKLERDLKNKMLGGVCAGFANFFGIEIIWVRLLTLGFFFGLLALPPTPGFVMLAYVILWIAMPGTYQIEETELPTKKLLRNPRGRVFAGVSGGLSAYFSIDVTLVRLVFVALIFLFGTGLLLYICLWIVMPKAKTITDMMFMSGEPVTISGIDQRAKKQQEQFRSNATNETLGARLVDGVGQAVKPVFLLFARLVAVFAGLVLGFIGFILLFVFTIVMAVMLKVINPESDLVSSVQIGDLFPAFIAEEISNIAVFSAFGVGIVPVITIILVSISLISQQWMIKWPTALILISLWIASVATFAYQGIPLIQQFQKEETVEVSKSIGLPATGNLTLTLHDIEGEKYVIPPKIELTIKGYSGDSLKLIQILTARGYTADSAVFNAKQVEYQTLQVDSLLSFDSNLKLKEGSRYRIQTGKIHLYIPYNKAFRLDPKIHDILYMTLSPAGYDYSDLENNLFMFTENGLKCITCKPKEIEEAEESIKDGVEDEQ